MALPKTNRLKYRQDFRFVYQKGSRYRSGNLTLRILRQVKKNSSAVLNAYGDDSVINDSSAKQPTRIGISISQKVSKRAVVRNRIKRQIRACLRELLPRVSWGWDLVIIAHPQAIQCDYFQFLQELEQLLLDAEVLDGHS